MKSIFALIFILSISTLGMMAQAESCDSKQVTWSYKCEIYSNTATSYSNCGDFFGLPVKSGQQVGVNETICFSGEEDDSQIEAALFCANAATQYLGTPILVKNCSNTEEVGGTVYLVEWRTRQVKAILFDEQRNETAEYEKIAEGQLKTNF